MRTFGFIRSNGSDGVFFHVQNVLGPPPPEGTDVWYSKFDGSPKPRAIPVVPMKPDANAVDIADAAGARKHRTEKVRREYRG